MLPAGNGEQAGMILDRQVTVVVHSKKVLLTWTTYSTWIPFQETLRHFHHHWLGLLPRLRWMYLLFFDVIFSNNMLLKYQIQWVFYHSSCSFPGRHDSWPDCTWWEWQAPQSHLDCYIESLEAAFAKLTSWLRWNAWLMSKRMFSSNCHRQVSWMLRMQTHISGWFFMIHVSHICH